MALRPIITTYSNKVRVAIIIAGPLGINDRPTAVLGQNIIMEFSEQHSGNNHISLFATSIRMHSLCVHQQTLK